jgi:dihydrolipoamide dehydrogenase
MPGYRVAVIGGGPAGYAAALKAAECGAEVTLIEAEQLGGACVNYACIPTNILLRSAIAHVDALEMGVMGVFEAGETFNFGRAAARKDALVRQMRDGIAAAVRMRKVTLVEGRASFRSANVLEVATGTGRSEVAAEAFVIATGTRWEPPSIPGIGTDRLLTADGVQTLTAVPRSAVVIGGGPAATAFALEYAALLAIAGSEVTLASPGPRAVAALDSDVSAAVEAMLAGIGVRVVNGVRVAGGDATTAVLDGGANSQTVPAEIVVAADVRRPYFETLGLAAAGVAATNAIAVNERCRTSAGNIWAGGDVTGGAMLSSVATHMGEVAGANAAGDNQRMRLEHIPHVLHTVPETAWIGLGEDAAKAAGHLTRTGVADLSFNARSVVAGGRQGVAKVIADAETGAILGVQAAGVDAAEIVAVAAALMQSEATVEQLASMVFWHPSAAEGLRDAARRAAG